MRNSTRLRLAICGAFDQSGLPRLRSSRHHVRPGHPGAPAAFVGLAPPDHRQIAVDGKRAVQFFGHLGIERRFDPVPVEEHDDQHQHGQQHNEAGQGPGENLTGARHCTELLIRLSVTIATLRRNAGPEPARHAIYDWKMARRFNRKVDFAAIDGLNTALSSRPPLPGPHFCVARVSRKYPPRCAAKARFRRAVENNQFR